MTTTTFEPIKTEELSSAEFVKLMQSNLANEVANTKYVLGKLGSDQFGSFKVEYKTPVLR